MDSSYIVGGPDGFEAVSSKSINKRQHLQEYVSMERRTKTTPLVELTCTNCGEKFHRSKYDIARRKYKRLKDNNFCTKKCVGIYNHVLNKERIISVGTPHRFKKGRESKGNPKYDQRFSWYIRRCSYDGRFDQRNTEWRIAFDKILQNLWDKQEGKCAVSGVKLELRDTRGKTLSNNKFSTASLDRIDNVKGYEEGNIQWVSYGLNLARNKQDYESFVRDFQSVLGSMC